MSKEPDNYSSLTSLARGLAIAAISIVGIAMLAYVLNFAGQPVSGDPGDWGTFGDFFGGTLGPVLNLITVILLVGSLLFQRIQVADAKEGEAEARKHSLDQHSLALKQSFEQTFFAWLNSHRAIVASITLSRTRPAAAAAAGVPDTYAGTVALQRMWDESMAPGHYRNNGAAAGLGTLESISAEVDKMLTNAPEGYDNVVVSGSMIATYESLYRAYMASLDTMFRTFQQMIVWIDGTSLSIQDRFFYVGIIRAHLSSVEMWFLMTHSLTDRGEKLRSLINRYGLLDDMEPLNLLEPLRGAEWHGEVAFIDAAFCSAEAMKRFTKCG